MAEHVQHSAPAQQEKEKPASHLAIGSVLVMLVHHVSTQVEAAPTMESIQDLIAQCDAALQGLPHHPLQLSQPGDEATPPEVLKRQMSRRLYELQQRLQGKRIHDEGHQTTPEEDPKAAFEVLQLGYVQHIKRLYEDRDSIPSRISDPEERKVELLRIDKEIQAFRELRTSEMEAIENHLKTQAVAALEPRMARAFAYDAYDVEEKGEKTEEEKAREIQEWLENLKGPEKQLVETVIRKQKQSQRLAPHRDEPDNVVEAGLALIDLIKENTDHIEPSHKSFIRKRLIRVFRQKSHREFLREARTRIQGCASHWQGESRRKHITTEYRAFCEAMEKNCALLEELLPGDGEERTSNISKDDVRSALRVLRQCLEALGMKDEQLGKIIKMDYYVPDVKGLPSRPSPYDPDRGVKNILVDIERSRIRRKAREEKREQRKRRGR